MQFDMDAAREIDIGDDTLVHRFVPKRLQRFDAELYATKWFDYRRMTPAQATREYIEEYCKVYRTIYAREFDAAAAKYIQPVNPAKMFAEMEADVSTAKRKFSAFWRGRQIADALTMPYGLYIEWALTFRLRNWNRPHMPQPQHLYHEWDVERVQNKWEELQESQFFMPKDPAYLIQNYQNIPYQNDFHEWLFKQAKMRSNMWYSLAAYIEDDLLPVDKVASRLGDDFEKVESYMSDPR